METAASTKQMVVIMNPAAGSSDDDFRQRLEKALSNRRADYKICETTPGRSGKVLAREARDAGVKQVLACGGDGTVMAAINGLGADPSVTLGIIPGGTANLLATALKIPSDPEEAVDVALTGKQINIDLGRREETLFALGIGVGLTERLVSEASSEAKEKIGRWAYMLAMMKELGAKPHRVKFRLDGGECVSHSAVAVVIANAGEMGNGMCFAPDARVNDGRLDLCLLHSFGFVDVLRLVARGVFGHLKQDRALTYHQARHIELWGEPPLEVQIDGEPVDARTPVVAEVLPGALRVRVPLTSEL